MGWSSIRISALFTTWVAWFWSHGTRVGLSAITPYFRERLQLSIAEASAIPGFLNLGFYTFNLASGHLAVRLGYSRAVALGALGAASMMSLTVVSQERAVLYGALVAAGFFLSLHLPSAIPWLSKLFGAGRRGFIIGVHESAAPAGQTLGPIALTLLIASLSLVAAIPAWALISMTAGLMVFLIGWCGGGLSTSLPSPAKGLGRHSILSLTILTTGMLVGNLGVVAIVPLYLVDSVGLEKSLVAMIVGVSRSLGVVGQPLGGILHDKFGFHKIVYFILSANIISSAYMAYGLYNPAYIAAMIAQATSTAMFFPILYSHLVKTTGDRTSVVLGRIIFTAGLLGPTSAPLFSGFLAESYGYHIALTYPLTIICLGVPALLLESRADSNNAIIG
jgi:MFS family permease